MNDHVPRTPEQLAFIERLRRVMRSHEPPLILTPELEWDIVSAWREPDATFVAYAANVGPALGKKLWHDMQELEAAE